jgi:Ice-binding-like
MTNGVPMQHEPPVSDSPAASRRPQVRAARNTLRAGAVLLGLCSSLLFASSALAAAASVGLGTATPFAVLGGSTVTNTGPTTMFGNLGLSPGSSVTGAPHVLGETHVDDAVAIAAKNSLTTAFNDAASRPSNGSAGTDLAGQVFLPGVRTASSSLLLSSGSVTLDAQGNPAAVFIFQVGSTLITGSNTSVSLVNGAQACNVFWEIGSSATLGTGTRFVGTVMALASITANTAATIHGRLLARTGAVNLDTNTITNSTCASSATGVGGGIETTGGSTGLPAVPGGPGSTTPGGSAPGSPPIGSRTIGKHGSTLSAAARRRAAARRAAARRAARRSAARRVLPHHRSSFTG